MPNRDDDEVSGMLEPEVPTGWGRDKRRGWHFDKTVSIADLFMMVTICVPLLTWAVNIEGRFATFQERFINIERQRTEDQANTKDRLGDLQQQVRIMESHLNDKLDRIISERAGAADQRKPQNFLGDR